MPVPLQQKSFQRPEPLGYPEKGAGVLPQLGLAAAPEARGPEARPVLTGLAEFLDQQAVWERTHPDLPEELARTHPDLPEDWVPLAELVLPEDWVPLAELVLPVARAPVVAPEAWEQPA